KDHWDHVKKMLWKDRFWSRSYCLISVGDGASTEVIKQYIQNQERPS
ncbi:MAG: transposase, partial [Nitrincola sp.]|nr:transposase [Nitrincola sp.]